MLTFLRGFLLLVLGIYAFVFLIAVFLSDRMIFQPHPPGYSDNAGIIKLRSRNGVRISARFLANPGAAFTILFSHGNAEDIGDDEAILEGLRAAGFAVFVYDYQGYGTSEGAPSERHAYEDVDAAYDYLVQTLRVQPNGIIAFGRSVGGGPATELAFRRPVAGLILESSFTSAFRVLTRISALPLDKFNNLRKIKQVHCPVLVIHGTRDSVINSFHGRQLFAAANDPKLAFWVENANHNDVPFVAGDRYYDALRRFAELIQKGQKDAIPAGA